MKRTYSHRTAAAAVSRGSRRGGGSVPQASGKGGSTATYPSKQHGSAVGGSTSLTAPAQPPKRF